jgi:hypothetical protein
MISATAPMLTLTIAVAAVAWAGYDRSNAYDSGALADGMARHHFLALHAVLSDRQAGNPVAAGVRPDPAMGPFALHDWQSEVFETDAGLWLLTYPEDYPDETGMHGRVAMERVPEWLDSTGITVRAYGLWPAPKPTAEEFTLDGTTFDMPAGGFAGVIGERAPVIVSRVP